MAVPYQPPPWLLEFGFPLIFAGIGAAFFCFTDHICDWHIRLFQSRTYRRVMRGYGVLMIIGGVFFAVLLTRHRFD